MDKFNTRKKFKIETLKQEIESVVIGNYELEYWKNAKHSSSLLALSNYQNPNWKKKSILF